MALRAFNKPIKKQLQDNRSQFNFVPHLSQNYLRLNEMEKLVKGTGTATKT